LPFLEGRGAGHREVRRSLGLDLRAPSPLASALEKWQGAAACRRSTGLEPVRFFELQKLPLLQGEALLCLRERAHSTIAHARISRQKP
jgi:hypothetical protein